mgnify:CR=1 FL=1
MHPGGRVKPLACWGTESARFRCAARLAVERVAIELSALLKLGLHARPHRSCIRYVVNAFVAAVGVAVFESKEHHIKNAQRPEQNKSFEKMMEFLENPTANGITKDPAYIIQKSILDNYFEKIMPRKKI